MQYPWLTVHVRRFDRIICSTDDPAEFFILQTFPHDQRHVMCSRIVVRIRKTTGIYKMCICASDLCRTFIHHIYKVLLCAAYMFCNLGCDLVCRADHKCIKACSHAHHFSHLHSNIAGIPTDITCSCFRKDNIFFQGTVLHRQKQCHDFGNTCRITDFISALAVQKSSAVCIHQYPCLRCDLRTCRPA